jgi:GcrA cell cycle regulator
MMVSFNVLWPAEHTEALSGYLREGAGSLAQIASLMNKRFGASYSRNSIVGKARRLGIPSNRPPGRDIAPPKPKSPPPPPPPSVIRCVEVKPRHIALIELTENTCRWPYSEDAPTTYCGHPPLGKESYCGPHFYLSRRS